MPFRDKVAKGTMVDASEVTKALGIIAEQTGPYIDYVVVEMAKAVRAEARRIVPRDTGHLRKSIRYQYMGPGAVEIFASTYWGGVRREYAARVHEDMEARHTSGMAKFIERPLFDIAKQEMAQRIAREMLSRIQSGQGFKGAYKVIYQPVEEE